MQVLYVLNNTSKFLQESSKIQDRSLKQIDRIQAIIEQIFSYRNHPIEPIDHTHYTI